MSTYPLIADHGLIGNLGSAALVAAGGTIDWFLRSSLRLAQRLRLFAPLTLSSQLDRG